MPKTEANTRPDNRKVKQARSKKRQALLLFKRRVENLKKTDLTSSEIDQRVKDLGDEYMKIVEPLAPIIGEGKTNAMIREVEKLMSDKGFSTGRETNSDNQIYKRRNSADTPGKGSDEPITKRNKNKGGLIKTGAKDYRKGGMFY